MECLHVASQRCALAQRRLVPVCPICRASALTRCPAGSRTFPLRRVSRPPLAPRHCCFRPPLGLWAPRLAHRFSRRNVHPDDPPLNQLVGPSHENSPARCCRFTPESLRLSGSSTSALLACQARGPGRVAAGPLARYFPARSARFHQPAPLFYS